MVAVVKLAGIDCGTDDGVGRIALNRPGGVNRFDMETAGSLNEAIDFLPGSERIALQIRAESPWFCAGRSLTIEWWVRNETVHAGECFADGAADFVRGDDRLVETCDTIFRQSASDLPSVGRR